MNIFDKGFAPTEAVIRYIDGDYVVLKPAASCAVPSPTSRSRSMSCFTGA